MKSTKLPLLEIILLVSIALGVIFRFAFLNAHEFWYDEVLSVLLASGQKNAYQNPGTDPVALKDYAALLQIPKENGLSGSINTVKDVIKGILGDPHPPLFYLTEHVWMRLFGNGVVALRSLVALTSLGVLAVVYRMGRQVMGQRGALIWTGLMALNPFFLVHSLNLRMYALLMLSTVLSQWGLLTSFGFDKQAQQQANLAEQSNDQANNQANDQINAQAELVPGWQRWAWLLLVAGSITAGLLSQYLFAYTLFGLAALVLVKGRKHLFRYGLTLALGVFLTLPWVAWGTRQQIKNRGDVLSQLSDQGNFLTTVFRHVQDISQTLANHLLLGHWTTGFEPIEEPIKPLAVGIGLGVIAFLSFCVVNLYRQKAFHTLAVGLLLGVVPLAVALGIDIVTNKFTVGFGWGRSTMVAIPGCLLLIAGWLYHCTGRWQVALTSGLLALYLVVGTGEFVSRDRNMFHTVDAWLSEAPAQPTLVAINSNAWGNVLRLAYYLNADAPIELLATDPQALASALDKALTPANGYQRVLWLNATDPVWSEPETPEEAAQIKQAVSTVLSKQYTLKQEAFLTGTMDIDRFEAKLYGL
jgi:uncharacterized membrane protein